MLVLMPARANGTEVTPYGTFVPYARPAFLAHFYAILFNGSD
jgi:hypothetical protein